MSLLKTLQLLPIALKTTLLIIAVSACITWPCPSASGGATLTWLTMCHPRGFAQFISPLIFPSSLLPQTFKNGVSST